MSFINDDIYIDLNLSNSVQTSVNDRVPVDIMQSFTQSVLNSTNGYKLSIIRFYLDTTTLPVFIPSMQSDTTTIYSFTMELNGISYQQFMEFIPQNINPVEPDEKYHVYSYQYLIYLMNKCLASCLEGLNELVEGITTTPPSLSIDLSSLKCSMSFDDSYYGYSETGKINIYLNNAMYALLASIPCSVLNGNALGKHYQINNNISSDKNVLVQDYSTITVWNPISSIVFTSNLLPIYSSQTPPLQIYTNGTLSNTSSDYRAMNILTDFVANDKDFTPYVQYAPSIYRFVSLKSGISIKNVDLQVYWMNKHTGELKKLYLGPGGTFTAKIYMTKSF